MQTIVVKITSEDFPKPFTTESVANALKYGTLNQYKITVEQVRESVVTEAVDLAKAGINEAEAVARKVETVAHSAVDKVEGALHIGRTQSAEPNQANTPKSADPILAEAAAEQPPAPPAPPAPSETPATPETSTVGA